MSQLDVLRYLIQTAWREQHYPASDFTSLHSCVGVCTTYAQHCFKPRVGPPQCNRTSAVLRKYDEERQKQGGFVRSIADDVYFVGPPRAVAAVCPEYKEDLKEIGTQ